MAADEKWYFTKEQLGNTPSRKCGIDADKELSYRQQAANFIQDMGQRLSVTQLCINTAIVYMHRFYVFHSLSQFHRNAIASAALFLAAKVEEQPRKLEHVIKVVHMCLHRDQAAPDPRSEQYLEQAQDLVFNENVLLQTLGFDVAIDHPHTHVVRCCHLVKASKDLAQTSYFMASNSLHLTTMCLQYKPTVVACFCIHLACKWSNWEIPQSNEGKDWFWYVDSSVTAEQLKQLTTEFLHIFDKCPSRLKRKIMSISASQSPSINHPSLPNSLFDAEPRRVQSPAMDGGPTFQSARPFPAEDPKKPSASSSASSSRPPNDYREYRERKERLERIEREKAAAAAAAGVPNVSLSSTEVPPQKPHHSHSHHAKQQTSSSQPSSSSGKHPSGPNAKPSMHHNHHGAHRTDAKPGSLSQPSQRHSSTSSSAGQSNRPRMPRDYNVPPGNPSNQPPLYPHGHQPKEPQITNSEPPDMSISTVDSGQNMEKLNHNREKHEKPGQRGYDPRNKILDHRGKDSEQKAFAKYQQEQQQQAARNRKPGQDIVEQRSEEVRKLIDKPIAPLKTVMKPDVALQREDYIANMLKQPQNPKPSIAQQNQPRNHQDYGLLPVSRDKTSIGKNSQHGSKYEKSDVKNGNSEDKRNQAQSLQQPSQPIKQHKSIFSPEKSTPRDSRVSRQTRQKTPPSNLGTMKSSKLQERVPDPMGNLDSTDYGMPSISQIANQSTNQIPQQQQQQQSHHQHQHQHKRHRTSSIGDSANNQSKPTIKTEIKTEIDENYETMKMLGRVPELIQPIRDNPNSTNGRSGHSSVANDLKPPELIKPFEPEPIGRHTSLSNGLEVTIKREDFSRASPDSGFGTQPIRSSQDYLSPMKTAQSISALLQEPLAPMPSLLQGIPDFDLPQTSSQQYQHHDDSLNSKNLQNQRYHQFEHQDRVVKLEQDRIKNEQDRIKLEQDRIKIEADRIKIEQDKVKTEQERPPVSYISTNVVKEEKEVLSTVDISALSGPAQTIPEPENPTLVNTQLVSAGNDETTSSAITATTDTTSTSRKSEHHKSEKKKKKEKHKHKEKDKEKSRDKKKHKHKEKDKEKEKPITIKIPKNKLNMPSNEPPITSQVQMSSQDKTSPQATTGLKIKIPKERLQESVSQPIQGSLKMKIRTGGDTSESSVSVTTSSSSTTLYASVNTSSSRKRDRGDNDATPSAPPSKKQQVHHHTAQNATISSYGSQQQQMQQQQQQVQQKQNGRHYSSNNKEKHSSSHHKSSSKLTQAQQQQLLLQQKQSLQQQQQQHSHAT